MQRQGSSSSSFSKENISGSSSSIAVGSSYASVSAAASSSTTAAAAAGGVKKGSIRAGDYPLSVDILFSGKATHAGKQYGLTLTKDYLDCFMFNTNELALRLYRDDIFGVHSSKTGSPTFTIHVFISELETGEHLGIPSLAPKKGKRGAYVFKAPSLEEAEEWIKQVRMMLNGVSSPDEPVKRRKFLFVVNPYGGTKTSNSNFESRVVPMLKIAGVDYDVVKTTHVGHGVEIGRTIKVDEYEAIGCVSGDGVLSELLNGLLTRSDWREACKIPLCPIPAGSGNAIAFSLASSSYEAATMNMLKGHAVEVDVMSATMEDGKQNFGFLTLTSALIADIDMESERYRFLGGLRFDVVALLRITFLRKYRFKIAYLPYDPNDESESKLNSEGFIQGQFGHLTFGTLPPEWVKEENDFSYFCCSKWPYVSPDTLLAPCADPSDGAIDVGLIKHVSATQLLDLMLNIHTGDIVDRDYVTYEKAKAVILEPEPGCKSALALDGERLQIGRVVLECHKRLVRIISPKSKKFPIRSISSTSSANIKSKR